MQFRPREALADDLCFECDALWDGHPVVVAGEAGLALFVDEEDEFDHSCLVMMMMMVVVEQGVK